MPSPQEILALVHKHAWWPLAALAIGLLVWAAKQPWFWGGPLKKLSLTGRARVVLGLGVLSGVLDAIARGTPWADAIGMGLVSALAAMGVHDAAGGLAGNPPLLPRQVRVTAPPGATVSVSATLDGKAPPAGSVPRILAPPDITPPPVSPEAAGAPAAQLDFEDARKP